MKHWFYIAMGTGVGYALGSQTGEVVRRQTRQIWEHPFSQGTLAIARGTAERWGSTLVNPAEQARRSSRAARPVALRDDDLLLAQSAVVGQPAPSPHRS